ncbi:hypothetical protein BKA80DRAFT_68608 [Phyllosticta citrichinensis]
MLREREWNGCGAAHVYKLRPSPCVGSKRARGSQRASESRGCGCVRREGCSAELAFSLASSSKAKSHVSNLARQHLQQPSSIPHIAATVGQGYVTPPATSSQDQPRWPWIRAPAPITTTAAAGCPARLRWARGRGLDLVATLPSDCLIISSTRRMLTAARIRLQPLGHSELAAALTLALPITVFFNRPSAGYLHFVLIGPRNV